MTLENLSRFPQSEYPLSQTNVTTDVLWHLIEEAEQNYAQRLILNPSLDRKMVSFQANKNKQIYRLFKYKEGFSSSLVSYFIRYLNLTEGCILDPFGGTGTTSIVSAGKGISSVSIELLPIGNLVSRSRLKMIQGLSSSILTRLHYWHDHKPWKDVRDFEPLMSLRITKGAYPDSTEESIAQYLDCINNESEKIRDILFFALCAILEEVSYTRKDGQYLRWDDRSGRRKGKKKFDKGKIYSFDEAIQKKINHIIEDTTTLFSENFNSEIAKVDFIEGTCLSKMQDMPDKTFEAIITSPPYCNRYDYTRTYALELALLGADERKVSELRQTMISCTVENKSKDLVSMNKNWKNALFYCENHQLLVELNKYLMKLKNTGNLNNNHIPRMVDGYFKEMACVIYESARVLKDGGCMLVVNDNVQYAGVPIPVDTILSDIARYCGLKTVEIMILPLGKGNSSQQMGIHGRNVLRKCVYVWKKE